MSKTTTSLRDQVAKSGMSLALWTAFIRVVIKEDTPIEGDDFRSAYLSVLRSISKGQDLAVAQEARALLNSLEAN